MGNRIELDQMGKRILDATRTELYLSMRFLGPALHSLGFVMDLSTTSVGTDAAYIRFNPSYLLRLYVDRPRTLNRTYLHMLLHCVFRHMFTAREKKDRELWDLACDISVSSIIDSMEYGAVAELASEYRQRVYDLLTAEVHVLTAERIYQYYLERKRNYLEELQLRAAFALCDHSFWERMEEDEGGEGQESPPAQARDDGKDGQSPEGGEDPDRRDPGRDRDGSGGRRDAPGGTSEGKDRDPGNPAPDRKRDPDSPSPGRDRKQDSPAPGRNRETDRDPAGRPRDGRNGERAHHPPREDGKRGRRPLPRMRKTAQELEDGWRENAKRMEAELLASGKEPSAERGSLDRILQISNRRRTDYRAFLRKFAVLREVASVDPDSFDYGFYNYGLEVYGNMPLIEENEYRELHSIRTLVIAIDTSGSCQDVLVQRFLNETAAVLRSIGRFFHTSEVRIIECDEHVQQETVVRSTEDLERYAAGFHVKGGFGTDFRPVFAYVEEKRRTGEIRNLGGLMYFTDGMGFYPEKPTDYDTAFVFFEDGELDDTKVPDWAIRLYLEGEGRGGSPRIAL